MAQAAQDTSMPGGMPIPLPPPRPADLTPAVPRPAPLGNPVAPYAQAFGGGLGVMPNAMFFNPGATSPAPANVPLPPERPASVMPGATGMGFAPRGNPVATQPSPANYASMFGPASVAASNEAQQALGQGEVGTGIGSAVRAGALGAGHVAAAPFVAAANGASVLGTGLAHFAHGLFGTTPAAAVPAQVAGAPVVPAAAGAPAPFGVAYNPAAGPTEAQAATIAQAQASQLAGLRGGVSTPLTRYLNQEQSPPVAVHTASAGMPMADDLPKGFSPGMARLLPRGGLPRLAAIGAYQGNLAQAQNETIRSGLMDNIQAGVDAAMRPVSGETPVDTAARQAKARDAANTQLLILQNPQAAYMNNLLRQPGQ